MIVNAFVPAKGSSSRVSNKNQLRLFNEPLYFNALSTLTKCQYVDKVILDTESHEFIEYTKSKGEKINILERDPQLATNQTDGNQLLLNEAEHFPADIYVQYLSTSPFISPVTIDQGIKVLLDSQEYDSVVAVKREKLYLWSDKGPLYDIDNIPNSFNMEDTIIETMGLYIIRHNTLMKLKRRIGENPFLLSLNHIEAIDINYPEDYAFAQIIERGIQANV